MPLDRGSDTEEPRGFWRSAANLLVTLDLSLTGLIAFTASAGLIGHLVAEGRWWSVVLTASLFCLTVAVTIGLWWDERRRKQRPEQ